jgi:hypothetical protein
VIHCILLLGNCHGYLYAYVWWFLVSVSTLLNLIWYLIVQIMFDTQIRLIWSKIHIARWAPCRQAWVHTWEGQRRHDQLVSASQSWGWWWDAMQAATHCRAILWWRLCAMVVGLRRRHISLPLSLSSDFHLLCVPYSQGCCICVLVRSVGIGWASFSPNPHPPSPKSTYEDSSSSFSVFPFPLLIQVWSNNMCCSLQSTHECCKLSLALPSEVWPLFSS